MEESFLTVAEIAKLLKINQQTVRNWIDQGRLGAVRVGQRRVRVRQSDLDRFLAADVTAAVAESSEGSEASAPAGGGDSEPAVVVARDEFVRAVAEVLHTATSLPSVGLSPGLRRLAAAADAFADALDQEPSG